MKVERFIIEYANYIKKRFGNRIGLYNSIDNVIHSREIGILTVRDTIAELNKIEVKYS